MKIRKRYILLLLTFIMALSLGYGLNNVVKGTNFKVVCSQPLCKDLFQNAYWWLRANIDPRKINYDRLFQKKPDTFNIIVSKKDIDAFNSQIKLGLNEGFMRDEWKKWRNVDLEIGSEKFKNIKMKLHGTSVTPIRNGFSFYEKMKKAIGIDTSKDFKGLSDLKASFKLKLNKSKFFNGVRRITLISIMDDWDVTSLALTKMAKKIGLIVSVPTFKQVYINGSDAGLFLVMEEIDKELLERNYGITNYGILKSNDVWDKPYGQAHISMTDDTSFDKEQSGTIPARNYALGKFMILMNAVKNKNINKIKQLIDINDFAKFSAIERFYGTNHSSAGDNLRYLYNFSKGTFRLILRVEGGAVQRKNLIDISMFDDQSIEHYPSNVILALLYSDRQFLTKRRSYLNYLITENLTLENTIKSSMENLKKWSKRTSADITKKINESNVSRNYLDSNIAFIIKYLSSHKFYISHLVKGQTIEILNESTFNILVTGVQDCNNKIYQLENQEIVKPNFYKKEWLVSKKITVPENLKCLSNVFFKNKNTKILSTNIFINSRIDILDTEIKFPRFRELFNQNVYYKDNNWFIKKGDYTINNTIILPYGINLILNPGVKINLASNVGFLIRGNLNAVSDNEVIEIKPKEEKEPFSSFAVLGSTSMPSKVNLKNFSISGGNEDIINGVYFSGQMSIHNAEVIITKSEFLNSSSDDGLNIKYSNVKVSDSKFMHNMGDAFDCDFCKGFIKMNIFKGLESDQTMVDGTDGLDLSGSKVLVEKNKFLGFSDKALSIGERSRVDVNNNVIKSSNIGIAVKDASIAYLKNNTFELNKKNTTQYIKKRMYSAPQIINK